MKNFYLSIIKGVSFLEKSFCYIGLLTCCFLVFFQVLNRYLLHYEIMWIGDLSLYIFVPTMIISIALTTREGGHTSVGVFVDLYFSKTSKGYKIYLLAVNIIVVTILAYLLPMALRLFSSAVKYPEYGTLVLWFNTSWIRESVLIMIVLCMIHTIHYIGLGVIELCQVHKKDGGLA